jgi:PKD repeat protein
MPRHRQLSRLVHVSRRSRKSPAQADPTMPRRRALRRFAVPAAAAALLLIVTQVVLAVPPTNVSFNVDDSTPTRGQAVRFTASDQINDPDGGTITSYDWDFGDGTVLLNGGPSVQHTYSTLGTKPVTLTVTDSANEKTTSEPQNVEVVNVAPTAAVSCSPSTVSPGGATTCNSNGSSDAEGSITYAWDGDGDGQFDSGRTDPTEQFSFADPGTKTITLQVRDADGATAEAQDTVTVSNVAPTARFTFSPQNPTVNQTISFDGSGSTDPEGQALTYAWDLDGDGQFGAADGEPTSVTTTHSFPTAGNKTVQLRVTDPQNNSDVETQIVPVGGNPPSASFNFSGTNPVTPAVPDVGETINFTSTSTDPDGAGDIARLDWDLDGDGQFNNGSGESIQHSFATPGNKTVGLRVTDLSGNTHSTTRTVRVNALPVARPSSLNPQGEPGQRYNVPLIGQPIQFTAGAVPALPGASPAPGCPASGGSPASPASSDAEGPIAKYEWDLDGTPGFETDRGTDPNFPHPGFPAAGDRTAILRVTDSDGATAQAALQFRVNTAPTAAFVYEPFTPIIGQEVTFGSTSSDPDPADSGKHIYSWDLDDDGTFCEAGETGASVKHTFQTANTNPGHRVRMRVTDDGGITREVPRNVPVQLTVPTGSIIFSPEAPLPEHPVTFTGSASSPTGKAIASMEWDFSYDPSSGQFDVEATGASVVHRFATPGPKSVALRIQEAGGGFAIVRPTSPLIVNAPPRAGFTVSPGEAFVGDGVTLSSTSADPDGPLTRQDWDLDNDGQFDDANAAVVSANFTRAGTYPLALRVTDARGATSTATGQVVIRTRPVPPPPPTPPTPLLSGVLIELQGRLSGKYTKVRRLLVRAPKASMITVRCLGKKCPKRVTKQSKGSKKLRFKKLERRFRPKTKLIVSVTKNGFIGKQTRWTMRRRKAPLRQDLCLMPGAKKATPCPAG